MTSIEAPFPLPLAIGKALKSAFPRLHVGNHPQCSGVKDKPAVLIMVVRNGSGVRRAEGREAQALSVSLKAVVTDRSAPFDACGLASQLMDLALGNRWGLPPEQCDVPCAIVAARTHNETDYDIWTVSFTQNLYTGPSLPGNVAACASHWRPQVCI